MKNKKKWVLLVVGVIVAVLVVIGGIHIINAIKYGRNVEYVTVPFKSSKVTQEMDGYKIVFITDTHQISGEELKTVVEEINAAGGADLVALGGDYPNFDATERTMQILSQIDTVDGFYGVEGNHDHYKQLFEIMENQGMNVLSNNGMKVRDNFFVAGVEDLWNRNPDVALATQDASDDDFVLLIAHNPDITMQQSIANVDLTLSGHTHGGHVTFFGVWAPALSNANEITDYGQRFMSGMCYNNENQPVYVSNGTGYYSAIPRMFARPQVITIVLESD